MLAELLQLERMPLSPDQVNILEEFFQKSHFETQGAVITDLDGTAVHEHHGKIIIHKAIELGLKNIYDLGRPVVINTLRFPLSVIRTFGREWYKISGTPIPVVLLNGSQLGYITMNNDEFGFEQIVSFPLNSRETEDVLKSVERLMKAGIMDFILFYYYEDWTCGEIIWTPDKEKIPHLQKKYRSASSVSSSSVDELAVQLTAMPVCMVFLLIEIPDDKLMAYQHTKRNNFITHQGVDKSYGTRLIAEKLKFELSDSIGAGDSEMDVFLQDVGLSVHVHNKDLPYTGKQYTLKLEDFDQFGDVLKRLTKLQKKTLIK